MWAPCHILVTFFLRLYLTFLDFYYFTKAPSTSIVHKGFYTQKFMGYKMQLFELQKDGHLLVECSLLILGQGFCGWCRL
jgi:hypothetical protein